MDTIANIGLHTVLENTMIAFIIIFVTAGVYYSIKYIYIERRNKKRRVFGNPIVGTWYCEKCGFSIFPNRLKAIEDELVWSYKSSTLTKPAMGPHCKNCDTPMVYDEAA